jgi:cytochrome c peroxidase
MFKIFIILLFVACNQNTIFTKQGIGLRNIPKIIYSPTDLDKKPKDKDSISPINENEILAQYLSINFQILPNYANIQLPIYYNQQVLNEFDNTPVNNPITDIGATLGRVLFYDKKLSINNKIACASCHQQALGFSDSEQFSKGHNGVDVTGASSMRLGNVRFYGNKEMFWDRRAASLEEQSTGPIKDSVEMGWDDANGGIDALIEKMNQIEYYPILFKKAFGEQQITETKIQLALAQFMRSMVSIDSKWDQAMEQVYDPANHDHSIRRYTLPGYNSSEGNGAGFFMLPKQAWGLDCVACHIPPTFSLIDDAEGIGLDPDESTITKSPSLKNVALEKKFMHDGRFQTLEEVVAHYLDEVQSSAILDDRLKNTDGTPIKFSDRPMPPNADPVVIARMVRDFLKTLTDHSLINDPKYSNPFK